MKRITDLPDTTVQGICEAHEKGELAIDDELDECILRCAQQLANKGWWMWLFVFSNGELSTWRDLEGNHWVIDPEDGEIWEFGS